jgi:hypothetical protein
MKGGAAMHATTRTLPVEPRTTTSERARSVLLASVGAIIGLALAVLWSYELVDSVIGDNVANSVLGYDAKETAISGAAAGVAFAFVSGFAGTFTACNVAVFGALPQIAGDPAGAQGRQQGRLRAVSAALGWLVLGMLAVSAIYGAVAVLVGGRLPQLSSRVLDGGIPERLVQASVVFGLIGLAFGYLGLASLRLVPDPFAGRPRTRLLVLGALIGGFLVGRPYPLFHQLLDYAVATNNPLYGALYFCLQSLGNVLVVAAMAALLALAIRLPAVRNLLAHPERVARIAGVALIALGTFMIIYWDVRLPALFGYGWFPTMPWN